MTTGERIRAVRKEKGLTQKQLADRCGMADSAIRKYESGRVNPKLETLQRIATALNADLLEFVDIFPGDDTPKSFEATRNLVETIKKGRKAGKKVVFRDGALLLEEVETENQKRLERGNQILQILATQHRDTQNSAELIESILRLNNEDRVALSAASIIMFFAIQQGNAIIIDEGETPILPRTKMTQNFSDKDDTPTTCVPKTPPEGE